MATSRRVSGDPALLPLQGKSRLDSIHFFALDHRTLWIGGILRGKTLVNSPRRSRRTLLLLHTEPTWQPTFIRNVYINMISFREQRTIKRYPDFPRWREDGAEVEVACRWRASVWQGAENERRNA